MRKIDFFRQQRKDGGTRTGIEIDGVSAMAQFDPGKGEEDSALTWYVDVRCSGENLPEEPEAVRKWLIERSPLIVNELKKLAEELEVGLDFDPVNRKISGVPADTEIKIVCSAIRRIDSHEMGVVLKGIANSWENLVQSLPTIEMAGR